MTPKFSTFRFSFHNFEKKKVVENMIKGFSLFRSIDNRKAVIENSIDPLR